MADDNTWTTSFETYMLVVAHPDDSEFSSGGEPWPG